MDFFGGFGEIRPVDRDNIRARLGEPGCESGSNAARTAGDQCNFSFQ